MFVWRNADLPADPAFSDTLEGLGFRLNEADQVRKIANPDESWKFKINRNDRWNIKHREALNDCIRASVMKRLSPTGMQILRLPLGRNPNEPHVPILVSSNVESASRIIVVFGEAAQDLGIWAFRAIHDGLNYGSVVDFVKAAMVDKRNENVGLIIANTGQLIWHCGSQRAVTQQTWQAIPRPFANWGQASMSSRNKIEHNGDWYEHVKYVFDKVVWHFINGKKTRIDVIGMSEGGLAAIRHLQRDWSVWKQYLSGICLGDPQQTTYSDLNMGTLTDPASFTSFVASRCRGYVLSDKPVGTPQFRYRDHGCNCYSSGEALNNECIMPAAWKDMLTWLDMLHVNPEYSEHVMLRADDMDDEMRNDLDEQAQSAFGDDSDVSTDTKVSAGVQGMGLRPSTPMETNKEAMDDNVDGGAEGKKQPLKEVVNFGQGQENIKP